MSARSYAGGAAASTLSSGITSGDTTIAVASATTWPSSGAFSIVIDRGLAGEEKVLVASRSGNTLTITTRGYDGTSAAAHSSGATVECCATATDFQEANDHVNATTNVHGLSGGAAVVGTTQSQTLTNKTVALGSNTVSGTTAQFNAALSDNDFATLAGAETLTNKTLTSPTINGATADAASTIGGVSGTTLAADHAAWTSYTPTLTQSGAVTKTVGYAKYIQIGKTVHFAARLSVTGSGTGANDILIGLPVAAAGSVSLIGSGFVFDTSASSLYQGVLVIASATTAKVYGTSYATPTGLGSAGMVAGLANGDEVDVFGTYEAA